MNTKALAAIPLILTTLAIETWATRANAKPARCYFAVSGIVYINGTCSFKHKDGDGSFYFDDLQMKTRCGRYDQGPGQCSMAATVVTQKGTFGQLDITSPDRAKIYWNGGGASLHAHDTISPVTRNGACWENSSAKLCAW